MSLNANHMTPTIITVKNGKARPVNPYRVPQSYVGTYEPTKKYLEFESTVQWHDLWDTKFNFRTDFSGEIKAELVWVMYDDNDGYQEWNLSTHPDRDRNSGYITKQVYMADIPVLKVEKEEAKTVEGKTPEEILADAHGILPQYLNVHIGRITVGRNIEAMQAYSTQQNTALMEAMQKIAKELEVGEYIKAYNIATEALKPKP